MSPPLKRFRNLGEAEQRRIIEAARSVFEEQGYDAMSLNDLIRRLEISKGQFYYWFEDKADLFLTVLSDTIEGFRETFLGAGFPGSAEDFWPFMERLDRACGAWFASNLHHVPLWSRVMELQRDHELVPSLQEHFEPIESRQREIVGLGLEWGLVRNDIPLDRLLELLTNIREGFDVFQMENWEEMDRSQIAAVDRLRTKLTRALLEGD